MAAKPRTMATLLHISARHVRLEEVLHSACAADVSPTPPRTQRSATDSPSESRRNDS